MGIKFLRTVGFIEGLSFLLLLFFAMPMKYMMDNPIFVKYIGMAHGFLFVFYVIVLLIVCHRMKWSLNMFIMGLFASVLPFGPFVFDLKLKKLNQNA